VAFLDKIKNWYGKKQLLNLARLRTEPINCNYNDLHTIGILYDATNEANFKTVRSFVCKLKESHKEVISLGYVNQLHLEDFHIQPKEFLFFCRKDLNWYFRPTESSTVDFRKIEFDVLIDLCIEEHLPVRYVLNESPAKLKVGKYSEANINYYDMLIDISEEESVDHLFNQTLHYLKMMNQNK